MKPLLFKSHWFGFFACLFLVGTGAFADTVDLNAPLRDQAAAHGALFGCAVPYGSSDNAHYDKIAFECGIMTPENGTKMDSLHPTATTWNWTQPDALYAKAVAANAPMRFHAFVWHNQLPSWFAGTANSGNVRSIVSDHIRAVMQHFKGKNIHSWDVVNEAIETDDGRTDGLRNSIWMKLMGPAYIDYAFRTAAQYNTVPGSLLVYNDYGLEEDGSWSDARRATALTLLRGMLARGVPIDALGLQAHLSASTLAKNFEPFRTFLGEVTKLGLKVIVSELDVNEHTITETDNTVRDTYIANTYRDFLTVALSNPNVIVVQTWGIKDGYSWLQDPQFTFATRPDKQPSRPLLLDNNLNRKASWNAVRDAFRARPDNVLARCDTTLGFDNTAAYEITARHSSLKLDASLDSLPFDGNRLLQDLQTGTTPTWKIDPIDNGFVTITLNRTHKAMDAAIDTGTHDPVQAYGYHYATNQQWCIQQTANGYVKISNRRSGQVVSVDQGGTAQSDAIVQAAYSGANHEQWQISGGLIKQTLFDFENNTIEGWQASSANPNLKTSTQLAAHGVGSLSARIPIGGTETPTLFVDGNWDFSAYNTVSVSLGQGNNRLYNGLVGQLYIEVGAGHTRYKGPKVSIPYNAKALASLSLSGIAGLSDIRKIGIEFSGKPYPVKSSIVFIDKLAID